MYLVCVCVKTERRAIQRQESPHDLVNERRMRPGSFVRGEENKEGTKKRTRGANDNKTHCRWNNGGARGLDDDTDEENTHWRMGQYRNDFESSQRRGFGHRGLNS